MKRFLHKINLFNFCTLRNSKIFQRRNLLCFFSTIIFSFLFSFSNGQVRYFSNDPVVQSLNSSPDLVARTFKETGFNSQPEYFNGRNESTLSSTSFTSSRTGPWNDINTWGGLGIPGPGDDVTIAGGTTVTITDNTSTCQNI